jgi:ketosteroid isomerase-like protein
MENSFANHFAADWIDAWNAHNLERILSHYTNDFEMSSPKIIQIAGESSGRLTGKAAVGAYWKKALALNPNLKFELLSVLVGVDSITLHYKGSQGHLSAEVFHFDKDLKVTRAFAHYVV